MESNMSLSVSFKGAQLLNGQPIFNHDGAPLTVGGKIDGSNTQTAYFGRVVSVNSSVDSNSFWMGLPSDSYQAVGILQHDNAVGEYEPTKPNYILPLLPATAVVFGPVWIAQWGTAAAGSLTTPVTGCTPIYDITTGFINFMPYNSSIPTGYAELNATVVEVETDTNGVVLLMGAKNPMTGLKVANTSSLTSGTNKVVDVETVLSATGIGVLTNYSLYGKSTISGTVTGAGFIGGTVGKLAFGAAATVSAGAEMFGIMAQLDLSALPATSSITSGQISTLWVDAGATGPTGTMTQLNMIRITNTTATIANSMIYFEGYATNLFNFYNVGTAVNWYAATATGGATRKAKLTVLCPDGTTGYMSIYTD